MDLGLCRKLGVLQLKAVGTDRDNVRRACAIFRSFKS